jgi:flavin-dependent dehydrogenase
VSEGLDVAIVGGRVAGAITATLLGDAGHQVAVFEAATFPSDTISTHFFRGAGLVGVLRQLGVLGAVLARGAPRLTRQYFYVGPKGTPSVDRPQDPGDVGYSLSVRRITLDSILLDLARQTPGVEVHEATVVRGLLRDDEGRVIGVDIESEGRRIPIRARLVVGADGRGSFVAREVQAPELRREVATRAMYFRYLRDYAGPRGRRNGAEFSFLGDELVYAFPSDGAMTCLAISINLESFSAFRRAPEAMFVERVRAHPGVAVRFDAARPDGRLLGSGPKDAVIRRPIGRGWALVGDAGLHQDPWTGLGMDNAALQATYLAEAVDGWLRGRTSEARALETYHRRRDEQATPGFEFTATAGRDLSTL